MRRKDIDETVGNIAKKVGSWSLTNVVTGRGLFVIDRNANGGSYRSGSADELAGWIWSDPDGYRRSLERDSAMPRGWKNHG